MANQQTASLTGLAIIDNQGQLLLTPEELQDSVRVQLPADLPLAMAPIRWLYMLPVNVLLRNIMYSTN